jgi:hypothetical protein
MAILTAGGLAAIGVGIAVVVGCGTLGSIGRYSNYDAHTK